MELKDKENIAEVTVEQPAEGFCASCMIHYSDEETDNETEN